MSMVEDLLVSSDKPLDVLVIAASNGENLKLAERFQASARSLGQQAELVDLTTLDLPLFTPRAQAVHGIPTAISPLQKLLATTPRWVICAPEYNGSIPPCLSNAIAWLSVQGDDFRGLFNGRPIAIATHSGGGGMEVLISMRIQLAHLGAEVVGRQLLSNYAKPANDDSIDDLLNRQLQQRPLTL